MKRKINVISAIAFMAAISLTSCDNHDQRLDSQPDNTVGTARSPEVDEELRQAQQQFVLESDSRYNENQKSIDEFRANARDSKHEINAEYQARVDSLEKRNKELNTKAKNYKEADKSKWQSFKDEFNHDMDELGHALKDLTVDNSKDSKGKIVVKKKSN